MLHPGRWLTDGEEAPTVSVYRQRGARDCGPTCLRMVATHFGITVSDGLVLRLCPVGDRGVSLLSLARAADAIGLTCVAVTVPAAAVEAIAKPCIVPWWGGHFIVLCATGERKVGFADPAVGWRECRKEEFLVGWSHANGGEGRHGMALVFT